MADFGNDNEKTTNMSDLIVLGSGSSTGTPAPRCLLQLTDPPCQVCTKAMAKPFDTNPNYRCNPSLLIKYNCEDGTYRYIQIDAGKSFKEQVLRWYFRYKVPRLDALILTHEHADALLGLDDICCVRPQNMIEPMPVFLSRHTMGSVLKKFPYLVQQKLVKGGGSSPIQWHVIQSSCHSSFNVQGLEFSVLPVLHGEDYVSLGFLFGRNCRVAYISDVSRIPLDTECVISRDGGGQVDILFLDMNGKRSSSSQSTHYHFYESLEAVKRLQPKRVFFVGLSHEIDHEQTAEELADWSRREGIEAKLSYDGLKISIQL